MLKQNSTYRKRIALVTGASSGIGYAVASRLASSHLVVMSSKSEDRLNAAQNRISQEIPESTLDALTMDVRNTSEVELKVQEIAKKYGGIDILINGAGVAGGGITQDLTDALFEDIVNTNLVGVFRVTRAVLKYGGMHHQKWGRIVNIASTGGKQGVIFGAAYSASKHGVIGFTKSLGLELAKTGITVNAVCPGFVETSMAIQTRANYAKLWGCSIEEAKTKIEARIPVGRYISPIEVARLVEFLISEDSDGMIAQAINVCGGLGNY